MEDVVVDEAHAVRVPNLTDGTATTTTPTKASPPRNHGNSSEVADTCEALEHFMGLCRTCGKPNSQLHELFPDSTNAAPECETTAANDTSSAATHCPNTERRKVIVPAKAAAECQIDIDCILVEMEIWDLRIRANDGLPYRICPQCVRQFYIISKFRSKCIKVQQRLRSFLPEGTAAPPKVQPAEAVNNFINSTDEQPDDHADCSAASLSGSSMEVESTTPTAIVGELPTPNNNSQPPAEILESDEQQDASLAEATSIPEQDLIVSTIEVEEQSAVLQKDQEEQIEDLNKFLQAGKRQLGLARSFSYSHSPFLSPESPSFVSKAALKAYATPLEDTTTSLKCTLRTQRKRSYSAEALRETARENKSSKQVDDRISADLSPGRTDEKIDSPLRENRLDGGENKCYAVRQVYNCVVLLQRLKGVKGDDVKKAKVQDPSSVPAAEISRQQHQQILPNNDQGPRSPWRTKAEMKANALLGTEATVGQEPHAKTKPKRLRRNQLQLMITASGHVDTNTRTRPRRKLEEQPSENGSEISSRFPSKRLRTRESKTSTTPTTTTSSATQELIVRVPLTALTTEFQQQHFPTPEQGTGPHMSETSTPAETAVPHKDENFYKSALADCSEAAGALNVRTGVRAQLQAEGEGMQTILGIGKETEHTTNAAKDQQFESDYGMPDSQEIEELITGAGEGMLDADAEEMPSIEALANELRATSLECAEAHGSQVVEKLKEKDKQKEKQSLNHQHQPMSSKAANEPPSATSYHASEAPQFESACDKQEIDVALQSMPLLPAPKNDSFKSDQSIEEDLENATEPGAADSHINPADSADSSLESESSLAEEPCASSETSLESSQSSSPVKTNGFLNAFQKYCAETREKEQNDELAEAPTAPTGGESQALTHMPSLSESNLSEMNDVETTLNGILNEMQDTHIYTPVSSHTDDFFTASVYSPLSDQPETPANSMYADSPISGCISVEHSPYMLQKHTPSHPPDARGDANVFQSFNNYNECFTEDSTQSELIGFQNNIPCFENIELVSGNVSASPTAPAPEPPNVQYVNGTNIEPSNTADNATLQLAQLFNELQQPQQSQVVEMPTEEANHEPILTNDFVLTKDLAAVSQANMVHVNTLTNAPSSNVVVHSNALAHPQTTNVVHGNILVNTQTSNGAVHGNMLANPQTSSPKMQYITLSSSPPTPQPCLMAQPNANQLNDLQQMATLQTVNIGDNGQINLYTSPANQPELQWTTNAGAITAIDAQNNSTTTYYVNANDLYQSNLISTTGSALDSAQISALLAQQQTQMAFEKRPLDANENYIEGMQNQQIMIVIPHEFLRNADPAQHAQQQTYVTSNDLNTLTVTTQTPQTVLLQPNAINHNPTPQYITGHQPIFSRAPVHHQQQKPQQTHQPQQQMPHQQQQPPTHEQQPAPHQPQQPAPHQPQQPAPHQPQQQRPPPQSPTPKLPYHHQQSSDQKVNLSCRFCHKRPKFTNNLDYSNHIIATHPVETPFNCPHCPMYFNKRARRQQHIVEEHGPRSYQCAQCGDNFCAQRSLDLHLQRYHAPEPAQQQQQQQQRQQHPGIQQPVRLVPHPPQQQQQQQQLQHQRWLDGGHQQQSSLVRVEDVHLHVSAEQKGKKSIDLELGANQPLATEASSTLQVTGKKRQRILCCPDCDDNFDDQTTDGDTQHHHSQAQSAHVTPVHVTMPSPEQIEPDSTSTTTLRQFRKRSANSPTINSNINSNYSASSPNSPTTAANVAAEQLLAEQSLRTSHNCLFCDGRFTNEIALRKHHQMAHSNQATVMPFICKVCNRGFRMNTLLQRHMETHDSEGRPYECALCHIRFPRPSQLTLHKLTVHFLKKPFTCNDCDKQFANEAMLMTHIKFHGERNFECDICSRQFFVLKDLRKHRRIHSGGRFYKCKFCQCSYMHFTRYSAHMKSHDIPQSPAFVEDGTTKITESALTIQQNEDENLEDTSLADDLPEEPFESVDVQVGPMTPAQPMSSDVMEQ